MKITLDLFGFTKTVEVVPDIYYDRGEVNILLSYPIEELQILPVGVEIKAIDCEHSCIRFFECEDGKWRPRNRIL